MIRKNVALKVLGFVGAFALLSANTVMAGEALSWNLSRDMMTGIAKNPTDVWSFMETQTLHKAANYQLMPDYSASCLWGGVASEGFVCWQDLSTNILIGTSTQTVAQGIPKFVPAFDRAVLVRWKSPISGKINLMGRVSDTDNGGGDGINWFVDYQNKTLLSGTVNGTGNTFFKQNIPVTKGQSLYFIIDRGVNNDAFYDSTQLDIFITSQQ